MATLHRFSSANGLAQYQHILGKTVIDQLTSTDVKYAPLVIGGQAFSKHFLVSNMKIGNFHACRLVSRACKELAITSLDEFLSTPPEHFAALKEFGEYSCLVVLRVREWKHRAIGWTSEVTFRSVKNREQREEKREAKAKRRRRTNYRSRQLSNAATEILAQG